MVASVGTLVAAAFETIGYRAQGEVLLKLGGLVHQLGAFILMMTAIVAVASIAIYGSYSLSRWFLVGPGLFYFLVFNTVNSSGAEWQFGNEVAEQREDGSSNADSLNRMVGGSKEVKVAKPFDWYNQLVSSLSRSLVSVITNKKSVIKQVTFTARPKLMHGILGAKLTDPGLIALLEIGLKRECSYAMNDMRTLAYGRRDPSFRASPEYLEALKYYKTEFTDFMVRIEHGGPVYTYLVNNLRAVKAAGKEREYLKKYCKADDYEYLYRDFEVTSGDAPDSSQGFFSGIVQYFSAVIGASNAGNSLGDFSPEVLISRGVTCQRLWCWAAMGLDQEAQEIKKKVGHTVISDAATDEIKQLIFKEVETKFEKPAFDMTAERPDESVIPTVIVGVLMRKAFSGDFLSELQTNYARHMNLKTSEYALSASNYRENAQDIAKRQSQAVQADTLLYELFTLGMSLPYLQGLFLYGLALLYPFFCLLVLIPGKASGIFNWMALWAWVKSWDVGFAVAMVADDTIWKLMPHRSYVDPTADSSFSPLTIMESAFRPDPAYSLSGYYMIMGMFMVAIPVYCGEMVLGAKKAIGGKLMQGFDALSARVGRYGAANIESRMVAPLERYRDLSLTRRNQEVALNLGDNMRQERIWANAAGKAAGFLGGALGAPAAVVGGVGANMTSWMEGGSGSSSTVAGSSGAGSSSASSSAPRSSQSGGVLGFVSNPLKGIADLTTTLIQPITGLVPATAKSLASVGVVGWQQGVSLAQEATRYEMNVLVYRGAMEAYEYWKSDEMMMVEGFRTTASARGEFFNQPAPPIQAREAYDKLRRDFNSKGIGSAAALAADVYTATVLWKDKLFKLFK